MNVCCGNNARCVACTNCVNQSIVVFIAPLDFWNANVRPSHADCNNFVEPSTVFKRSSEIRVNSPLTSSNDCRNSRADSAPDNRAEKAATLRLSVKSNASFKSVPALRNSIIPSMISSNVFAGPPIAFANFPFASAKYKMMLRAAVAALDASNPAFANAPNNAVVSLTDKPNAFATGKTVPMDVWMRSNDNADLFVATANVASVSSVSALRRLNARKVEPATAAASARFAPTAVANSNTAFCIAIIEPWPKPSFANSVCNSVTCRAVYSVVRPNDNAESVNAFIPSRDVPKIVDKLAFACSNSRIVCAAPVK